jgi:hypothetical protein
MSEQKDGATQWIEWRDTDGKLWAFVAGHDPGPDALMPEQREGTADDLTQALLANPELRMRVMLAMPDKSLAVEERKQREAAEKRAVTAEAELAKARIQGRIVSEMWQRMGRNARAGFGDNELLHADDCASLLLAAAPAATQGGEGTYMVDQGSYGKGVYDAMHGRLGAPYSCGYPNCATCPKAPAIPTASAGGLPASGGAERVSHDKARQWVAELTTGRPSWHRDLTVYIDQQEAAERESVGLRADLLDARKDAEISYTKAARLDAELSALRSESEGLRAENAELKAATYAARKLVNKSLTRDGKPSLQELRDADLDELHGLLNAKPAQQEETREWVHCADCGQKRFVDRATFVCRGCLGMRPVEALAQPEKEGQAKPAPGGEKESGCARCGGSGKTLDACGSCESLCSACAKPAPEPPPDEPPRIHVGDEWKSRTSSYHVTVEKLEAGTVTYVDALGERGHCPRATFVAAFEPSPPAEPVPAETAARPPYRPNLWPAPHVAPPSEAERFVTVERLVAALRGALGGKPTTVDGFGRRLIAELQVKP